MNKSEFTSLFLKVPKAELHIHIEAVFTLTAIKQLYKKRFGKEMSKQEQDELFSYKDLNGFIQSFLKVQDLFTSEEDFIYVFEDFKEYLVQNGIVYCEAFFAPTAFLKKGFDYSKMVNIFAEQITKIKEETGIVIKLFMDVSRTFGLENALHNYNLLKEFPCEHIIGIGLGGTESKGPASEYEQVFTLAKEDGYKVVTHAGEDVGPESIWDSIKVLNAQRIGHCLTAIQDEQLMDYLVEQKIPAEICITSNTFTKAIIKQAKEHPVKTFFDKGMLVCINTDDPVFFKTNLLNELWICFNDLNFTKEEIIQLIKNSFTSSFLSDEEKTQWCNKVDSSF